MANPVIASSQGSTWRFSASSKTSTAIQRPSTPWLWRMGVHGLKKGGSSNRNDRNRRWIGARPRLYEADSWVFHDYQGFNPCIVWWFFAFLKNRTVVWTQHPSHMVLIARNYSRWLRNCEVSIQVGRGWNGEWSHWNFWMSPPSFWAKWLDSTGQAASFCSQLAENCKFISWMDLNAVFQQLGFLS